MANLQNSYDFSLPIRDIQVDYEQLIQRQPSFLSLIRSGADCSNVKTEWLEDVLSETVFTITGFGTDGTGTVFTIGDTSKLAVGQVVKFTAATGASVAGLGIITAITANTNFTITRNYAGTTLATVPALAKFTVTNPRLEGSSPVIGANRQQTSNYNYTEITDATFKLSKTALATQQYGGANTINYQLQNALKELAWKEQEKYLWHWRQEGTDSVPRLLGGLEFFMQSGIVNSTGGAISATIINNTVAEIWDKAGYLRPSLKILLAPNQQQRLSAFNTAGSNPLSTQATSDTRTGVYVNRFIESLTGQQIETVVDANMPKDQIWIIDTNAIERAYLRKPTIQPVSTDTDAEIYRIIMEHTLRVRNGKERFARITGLTI
jgi:hypothetical protein